MATLPTQPPVIDAVRRGDRRHRRRSAALLAIVGLIAAFAIAVTSSSELVVAETLAVPGRIADTRPGHPTVDGGLAGGGPVAGGTTYEVPVAGRAGVAADADSVVLNLTAVDARAPGFVTAYRCGDDVPTASVLNYLPGDTRAVLALADLDDSGSACLFVEGETDLVVDVAGWFDADEVEMPPQPARLFDSRADGTTVDGEGAAGGIRGAGATTRIAVAGRAGIPEAVGVVALSVTAVGATEPGHALAFDCAARRPDASTVNYFTGDVISNFAATRVDDSGDVCIYTSGETDLVVDLNGWFAPGVMEPVAAQRVLDTRPGEFTIDGDRVGGGPIAGESTERVTITGRADVPAGTSAVMVNLTVAGAQEPGHLIAYGGADRPSTSNVNYGPGGTIANAAIAHLDADGALCIFAKGDTHVVVDVIGYFPGTAPAPDDDCGSTGPSGLFPERRIVALYGNDADARLGVLGEQPPDAAAARLAQVAAPFSAGDRPVQGAFELIATIAAASPGPSGLYRIRSSDAHVQRYLDAAVEHDLLLILDIQPGRADILTEVQHYDEFIRHPLVHVAIDPEWAVGPDQVPGEVVGQVSASEVNEVARYLASIVRDEGLPEKLLVVHQFQSRMVTDRGSLERPPGVEVNVHMDGFGTQQQKLSTYGIVQVSEPFSNGFKLFYDEDIDMFEPWEVLDLDPVPDLITYQ